MILTPTPDDLVRIFPAAFLERGQGYFAEGRVLALNTSPNSNLVSSMVTGSHGSGYRVYIEIKKRAGGNIEIAGDCSCPMEYNCKHVVATLLAAMDKQDKTVHPMQRGRNSLTQPNRQSQPVNTENPLPAEINAWLILLEQSAQADPKIDSFPEVVLQRLLYVLEKHPWQQAIEVNLFQARLLKDGGLGKASAMQPPQNIQHALLPSWYSQRDREIVSSLSLLQALGKTSRGLSGREGDHWLGEMLATGRCFWASPDSPPLSMGEPRQAEFSWRLDDAGNQKIGLSLPEETLFLPFSPPWYLDMETHVCGRLETGIPDRLAHALASAPTIPAGLTEKVVESLRQKRVDTAMPLLKTPEIRIIEHVQPIPCLHLESFLDEVPGFSSFARSKHQEPIYLEIAWLDFDYDGIRIPCLPQESATRRRSGEVMLEIQRDTRLEQGCIETLESMGFILENPRHYGISTVAEQILVLMGDWIVFCLDDLPQLRERGWRIEMGENFRFNIAEPEADEWTAHVQERGEHDWFGLELGIKVEGQAVNLAPILIDLIRNFPEEMTPANLEKLSDDEVFMGNMADGRMIALPVSRIRGILSVLVELFDKDATGGMLELSATQAARLSDLDEAASGLRWLGGERLRELGRKLKDFQGIEPIALPSGLRATLRPYQQEGLNWLQFLREYELAGILADDMGLGKTVQTLAHLLVEKTSGRMDRPCLVIAPTSLMFNWRREAEQFAPELRVLVLQGAERKQHFDTLADYDLVLSTYPLLARDQEVLTRQDFHYLILDEAHIIKNPKSQATRVVHQISARHRLALTGTPMENHLGELWSLFHFLLPGLLGDEKKFRQLFRTPIEKHADSERRVLLTKRIAPFLLRRTKSEVASELPPKTEMIRSCELEGAQRDLYEAIRVAMQEKVKQEIASKGMNRSQIVILDALLKLRQACCDPRLLKLPAAKKVQKSAKLSMLMEMLPDMIEEGRRILLFSQFTSMLALIELELDKLAIPYVKLTGETRDRATPVQRFQNSEIPLFLISLKAGGTGLNLTAADTVIHFDPWWNPAVESQATDRAHRIGQENPVFVYKLITEGTVEEKIVAMQGKKRELAAGVLEGRGENSVALSADDLSMLFEPLRA
ncbi:MAG: DEAD/DEAH box helicase [Sulfuricellaceae bacterium]|nr:DEAD/DEAH box helicase [Sulfuricellaceae bacterium]